MQPTISVEVAKTLPELQQFIEISNQLALESEDISLPEIAFNETAKFLYQNPEYSHVFLAKENATSQVIGTALMNREFDACLGEETIGVNSLFIIKQFRRRGVGSTMKKAYFREFWELGIKNFWLYVEGDNHNAIKIYRHWGYQLYPDLKIFCADFVLRDDPVTGGPISIEKNVSHFQSKLEVTRKKICDTNENETTPNFNNKIQEQNTANDEIYLRLLETKDLQIIRKNIKEKQNSYRNILNTKWKDFNVTGLERLLLKENAHKGYSVSILCGKDVVGVVTTLRDFSDWRAGFAIWYTGVFVEKSFENRIEEVLLAVQQFSIERVKNMSCDEESLRSNPIFFLFYKIS